MRRCASTFTKTAPADPLEGKYPGYNFYRVAGMSIAGKDKGEGIEEEPPVDLRSLLPSKRPKARTNEDVRAVSPCASAGGVLKPAPKALFESQ